MKEALSRIALTAKADIAAGGNRGRLEAARVKYVGKKGELTAILKGMGALSPDGRREIGQIANETRAAIEAELGSRLQQLKSKELDARLLAEQLDVTMPGTHHPMGGRHPIQLVLDEL